MDQIENDNIVNRLKSRLKSLTIYNESRSQSHSKSKSSSESNRIIPRLRLRNLLDYYKLILIMLMLFHQNIVIVGGGNGYYIEQYLTSPEICSPASAIPINKLATLAMEQLHLGNYPNYTAVIKLSRWQDKHSPTMFLNFRCRFEVVAPSGYGVMVGVREMWFRRSGNGGSCVDYVKFKPEGREISAPVCGEVKSGDKQHSPITLQGKRYHYDPKGGLDVIVNTGDYNPGQDNSRPIILELVLTAYSKKCPPTHPQFSTSAECSPSVCIPKSLFCDGYVNCGYESNYAVDEQNCPEPSLQGLSRGMSILLFILSAVGSLLAVGVCGFGVWCCVDAWKRGKGRKDVVRNRRAVEREERGSADSNSGLAATTAVGTLNRPQPTAPPPNQILTTDLDELTFIDDLPPNAPKLEDLPPSYGDLFPGSGGGDIFLSNGQKVTT